MKKSLSGILIVLIFFVGLSVLLYPTISNYWNNRTQSKAMIDYENTVSGMMQEDYSALFKEAELYNQQLVSLEYPLMYHEKIAGYDELLRIPGSEIMGVISIEKINVQLPIYHGTESEVLNVGVGHLKGSSLPTGGTSVHTVLSAHRGLPSAKLFSDLDKMEVGDIFTVTVLNRVLTYQVDQISVVKPEEVEQLYITEGQDYCTLITCTPYSINTHRLLVRGTRITEKPTEELLVTDDAHRIQPVEIVIVVAVFVLLIRILMLVIYSLRIKYKGETYDKK